MRNIKLLYQLTILAFILLSSILGLSILILPYIDSWQNWFLNNLASAPLSFTITGLLFIGLASLAFFVLIVFRKESYLTLWIGENPFKITNKLINRHLDKFHTESFPNLKWSHSSSIKWGKLHIYLDLNLSPEEDDVIFIRKLQETLKIYLSKQLQYQQPFYLHLSVK